MGKTYRKEKPVSKQRAENHPGSHGLKSIQHAQERTERKRILREIEEHWDDEDLDIES